MTDRPNPVNSYFNPRNFVPLTPRQEELLETAFGLSKTFSEDGDKNLILMKVTGLAKNQISFWFHKRSSSSRSSPYLHMVPHPIYSIPPPPPPKPSSKFLEIKSLKESIKKFHEKHAKTLLHHSAQIQNFQKKLEEKDIKLKEFWRTPKKWAEPNQKGAELERLQKINNIQVKDLLLDLKQKDSRIKNLEAELKNYKNREEKGAELKGAEPKPMSKEEKYCRMLEGIIAGLRNRLAEAEQKGAEPEAKISKLEAELQQKGAELKEKDECIKKLKEKLLYADSETSSLEILEYDDDDENF